MVNNSKTKILRLMIFIKPRRKPYLLSLLGISSLDTALSILFPLLVKYVLDAVAARNMDSLWGICLSFAIFAIILCCVTPLFHYTFAKSIKWIMNDVRLQVFHHMEKLPVPYYEHTHSGDSISRINNDVGVMEQALSWIMRSLLSLLMIGLYSTVIMFIFDWRFAIALVLMGLLSTYVSAQFGKRLKAISAEIQHNSSIQLERLMELITGTQVSRIFQITDIMNTKFKLTNQRLATLTISRMKIQAFLNSSNFLLLWISNGIVFIFGALMVIRGMATLGTLLSLVLLLGNVTNVFQQFGNYWGHLQSSLAGASRVFELLDTDVEPERYPAPSIEYAGINHESIIECRNGSFHYNENEDILREVSFTIEKGQFIAFVGPSGGGKSTIIKLLLGFYPLRGGSFLIEGKPFHHYPLSELRDKMAYVPQDGYLFDGTIEQNIRYGRMDATFEEVVAAANAAHAHHFIMEQADGYSTMVGERGARLSGGQRQRITIARALLKDAPILLLDEATSALDSESEEAVQQGLQNLMKGRTTISIAHRLSTILHADNIFVIKKGQIVEQGKHTELLEAEGEYSRLFLMQERKAEMFQPVS